MTYGDRCGIEGTLLKRYGGWKSQAYEGYIDPADGPIAAVARALASR